MSVIVFSLLLPFLLLSSPTKLLSQDWVGVPGDVRDAEDNLLRREQIFLSHPSTFAQQRGLEEIRQRFTEIPQPILETTVVAMITELLDKAYMTVVVGRDNPTNPAVRRQAVSLVADIGGATAQATLRLVVQQDPDRDIRMYTIRRMGETSPVDSLADMEVLSNLLYRATRSVGAEGEVAALIKGIRRLQSPPAPQNRVLLLESLRLVHTGPYSRSTREDAFSLLEELALR